MRFLQKDLPQPGVNFSLFCPYLSVMGKSWSFKLSLFKLSWTDCLLSRTLRWSSDERYVGRWNLAVTMPINHAEILYLYPFTRKLFVSKSLATSHWDLQRVKIDRSLTNSMGGTPPAPHFPPVLERRFWGPGGVYTLPPAALISLIWVSSALSSTGDLLLSA